MKNGVKNIQTVVYNGARTVNNFSLEKDKIITWNQNGFCDQISMNIRIKSKLTAKIVAPSIHLSFFVQDKYMFSSNTNVNNVIQALYWTGSI